tara:strand:- start:130 stop:555 length:426 start_codon:yes stop_codon:yes gene_type:complete
MADAPKLLGYAVATTGHTTIYACPTRAETYGSLSGTNPLVTAMVRSIVACNRHTAPVTFTVRMIPDSTVAAGGSALTPGIGHDVFHTVPIGTSETKVISPGIFLSQGRESSDSTVMLSDYLTVQASVASVVNFFVFGVEMT